MTRTKSNHLFEITAIPPLVPAAGVSHPTDFEEGSLLGAMARECEDSRARFVGASPEAQFAIDAQIRAFDDLVGDIVETAGSAQWVEGYLSKRQRRMTPLANVSG